VQGLLQRQISVHLSCQNCNDGISIYLSILRYNQNMEFVASISCPQNSFRQSKPEGELALPARQAKDQWHWPMKNPENAFSQTRR
jgi:hypothetical protein